METSVVVLEDAHQRTESTPFTKSSGIVMIDSIYIDLGGAMESQHGETKCDHFSIRGYAAEMRKKDLSICDPFSLDSNKNKSEEQASILPPLQVPEYKWWGCESCIQKIDATSTTNEAVMLPHTSESGFASTSNCQKQQSSSHPAEGLADSLLALKVDSFANGSTNAGTDETHVSSRSNIKEKKDHSRLPIIPIIAGHVDSVAKHVTEEVPRPSGDLSKSTQCLLQQRPADAPDAPGLQINGLVDYFGQTLKTVTGFRSLKPLGQNSAETSQLRVPTSPGFDQRIVSMPCETSKVSHRDKHVPSGSIAKGKMISRASLSPQKHDNLSSESDDMSAGSGNHDPQPNPIRQKAPKVRLLTELLGPEKATENDRVAEVGGSSSSMQVMSAELESVSVPYSDMADERSPKKRLGATKGKRKMHQDREWRPLEFMYPRKPTKKARRFNEDADSNENSESQSEDVSAGVDTHTEAIMRNNKYTPHMGNRNGMTSKKKHRQDHDQVEAGYYLPMPEQVTAPRTNYLSSGVAADNYFRSANDAFVNSRLKSSFGSSFPAKDGERKSSNFGKIRNKQHVGSRHGFLMPNRNNLTGQGSINVMDFEGERVNRQSAHEAAARNCSDLSRNGYATVYRNEKNFTSQKGDAGDLFSSQQRGTSSSRPDHKKKGLLCDLNENVSHGVPNLSGMNNSVPRFENGSFSRRQHSDTSDGRNGKKTSEVQDQGLDDIPMEIVELLARNQYERSHYQPEESYVFSTNTKKNSAYNNTFQAVDKNGPLKSLQKDNCWKPVPPIGKSKTVEAENSNKRNPTNCFPQMTGLSGFHADMRPPEEVNPLFSGFNVFSNSQQMNSGPQVSDSSSIRISNSNNPPQACKRKSNNLPNRYHPPSRVPIVEVLNSSSQRVSSGWDNAMEQQQVGPARTPFSLEIPDKRKSKLSNFDKQARFQKTVNEARDGLVDINFMNPSNLGSESFGRESFSPRNEFVGSRHRGIDLNANANEAIPAMQLLSLMDAGMSSSSSAFSIDGNPKFFTKPFFPCDHHPKASSVNGTTSSQIIDKPLFPYDNPFRGNMVFGDSTKNQSSSSSSFPATMEKACECPPSGGSLTSLFQAASNSFLKTGVSQTGVAKANQDSNKQKRTLIQSPPGAMMSQPHQQQNAGKDSNKGANLEVGVANGTAFGEGWVSRNDTCSVNRNPADFSVPGPKNIYMINGKDLRFGRRPRGRPRLYNVDGGRKLLSGTTPTDMKGKTQILPA